MPRFDTSFVVKIEANTAEIETEPGPIIVPIFRAERTFKWLNGFRNEPRFELAQVPATDDNSPDRAA